MNELCLQKIKNATFEDAKKYLTDLYLVKKMSQRQIGDLHTISQMRVCRLCIKFEIKALHRFKNLYLPNLTSVQKQVLYGMIISDGHINSQYRNPSIAFTQCVANKEFFDLCYNHLKVYARSVYFSKPYINHHKDGHVINHSSSYTFRTPCHPLFIDVHHDFYNGKKKRLTKNIFSKEIFTPLMLAVWFMGDGSRSDSKVFLCTQSFTLEEHKLMKKAFIRRFNITPMITRRHKNYVLRFNTADSKKFIEIVKPYIVPSMEYKILPILKRDWLAAQLNQGGSK